MNFKIFTAFFISLLLISCSGPVGLSTGKSSIEDKFFGKKKLASVKDIKINKEQIEITGDNLNEVVSVKLSGTSPSGNVEVLVTEKSDSRLVLRTHSPISFLAGQIFKLYIQTANAQSIIMAEFQIENSSIEITKLVGVLSGIGMSPGQTIAWNGTAWVPATLGSGGGGVNYLGQYNASTNTPDISSGVYQNGDFYIVNVAGSSDLGSGVVSMSLGDWILYDGANWDVLPNVNNVTSVFGRTGVVVAQANDYTWNQINKTSSSIGDIADVDLSSPPSINDVLMFNGTNWVPDTINITPSAGSITNTMLSGSIDQSKIANLVTDLVGKEGVISSGTTSQYYRGDKTWQTLNTTNVPEGTNLYFTNARVLSILPGADVNGVIFPSNMSQTLIVPLAPVGLTDATNKQYVDDLINSYAQWTKSTNDAYFTNKVSIGTSTIDERLTVSGNIKATGQIYSGVYTDTIGQINFSQGNTATTNYNCSGAMSFTDLFPGTAYTFVNTNTGTTRCDFSTTINLSAGGTQTVSYRFMPINDIRASNSHTIYSLMRVGNVVYVNWTTGY